MKKIILNLLVITSVLLLASCSEKSGNISDSNVKVNTQISNTSNDSTGTNLENTNSGEIQNITPKDDISIDDKFTLISIIDPKTYKLLAKNKNGDEIEFTFINKDINSNDFIISDLSEGSDWNNDSRKSCYISEINKQIFYNIFKKEIIIEDFTYDSLNKQGTGILKVVENEKIDILSDLLLKQGYFTRSKEFNSNLLCKCVKSSISIDDSDYNSNKFRLSSINDSLRFTLSSESGNKLEITDLNLPKLKMTAGLKSDCYLDMLKSQIQSNLNEKDIMIKDYNYNFNRGKIMLDQKLDLSLVDLLQRQGFLENQCNTNDIEPMLMKWCQK